MGSTAHDAAYLDSISECYFETMEKLFSLRLLSGDQLQQQKDIFWDTTLPNFIQVQENVLKKNGANGYYFGENTTLPDLLLFFMYERLNFSKPGTFSELSTPLFYKVYERLLNDEVLGPYLRDEDARCPVTSTSGKPKRV
ncbi:hypothetical protein HK098_006231 [Nowakowskiella sp. JEL0407]|nr:hypothetical protein HK098_006231 [Nowakowskiella sp. JEL0407]